MGMGMNVAGMVGMGIVRRKNVRGWAGMGFQSTLRGGDGNTFSSPCSSLLINLSVLVILSISLILAVLFSGR